MLDLIYFLFVSVHVFLKVSVREVFLLRFKFDFVIGVVYQQIQIDLNELFYKISSD